MPRRLPPLSALRAFEAAARHGSFKKAASELAVTPTAVSHQIRALEDYSGLALFERRTRKVVLTDVGEQLFPVLRDGFDAFAAIMERTTRRRSRAQVTISATIGFTARWLVPRVAGFQASHPEIDLQFLASDEAIDFDTTEVDIAIRYGAGPYPGFTVAPLFADRFAPVANPMLKIEGAADLAGVPLIDFHWQHKRPENPTWARWFAEAGLPEPDAPATLRFSSDSHAIQAAIAGQGVALASLTLVGEELAAGQLQQLAGPTIPGYRYHILTRTGETTAAVAATVAWLLAERMPAPSGNISIGADLAT